MKKFAFMGRIVMSGAAILATVGLFSPVLAGDEIEQEKAYYAAGVGAFASPASEFGREGGFALGGAYFGTNGDRYGFAQGQLEIGNGLGLQTRSSTGYNLLNTGDRVSLLAGGNLLDLDLDANTNRQSMDVLSVEQRLDLGVVLGSKDDCHGVLAGSVGLNSGTQGENGWFRPEHGALATLICGPLALGGEMQRIRSGESETVDQGNAALTLRGRKGYGVQLGATATNVRSKETMPLWQDAPSVFSADGQTQTMLTVKAVGTW